VHSVRIGLLLTLPFLQQHDFLDPVPRCTQLFEKFGLAPSEPETRLLIGRDPWSHVRACKTEVTDDFIRTKHECEATHTHVADRRLSSTRPEQRAAATDRSRPLHPKEPSDKRFKRTSGVDLSYGRPDRRHHRATGRRNDQ
jgi:hypothetical protein